MLSIECADGNDLLRIRINSLHKRFKSSYRKINPLFHEQFGVTFSQLNIEQTLSDFIVQANNVGGTDRIQDLIYLTEGRMAKRVVFCKAQEEFITPLRGLTQLGQYLNNRGFSSLFNNTRFNRITRTPSLNGIALSGNLIELRWAQLRKTSAYGHETPYYYSVKGTINLQNGDCILYFDTLMGNDTEGWPSTVNSYRLEIANFLACNIAEITDYPLGYALPNKLVEVLNHNITTPLIPGSEVSLLIPNDIMITSLKFDSETVRSDSRALRSSKGNFSAGDVTVMEERLRDINFFMTKLSCEYYFNDKHIKIDILSKGEIHITDGLLIEEEISRVNNDMLRRTTIAERPIFQIEQAAEPATI